MQNVVVGYDGSDGSRRAVERAAAVAAGGRVTVVTAVEIKAPSGARSMGVRDEDALREAREALDAAKADLQAKGVDAHALEGEGNPAGIIVEAAEEAGADLVVVGTGGHGAGKRHALGSVSTKVVHDAHCDVLVVR